MTTQQSVNPHVLCHYFLILMWHILGIYSIDKCDEVWFNLGICNNVPLSPNLERFIWTKEFIKGIRVLTLSPIVFNEA